MNEKQKGIKIKVEVTENGETEMHEFEIFPPFKGMYKWEEAKELCEEKGGRLPSISELAITHACQELDLIKDKTDSYYWSGSLAGSGLAWIQYFGYGSRAAWPLTNGNYVRCVRS